MIFLGLAEHFAPPYPDLYGFIFCGGQQREQYFCIGTKGSYQNIWKGNC
jgi:hypothetical protein